jgi:hypothetical protein
MAHPTQELPKGADFQQILTKGSYTFWCSSCYILQHYGRYMSILSSGINVNSLQLVTL